MKRRINEFFNPDHGDLDNVYYYCQDMNTVPYIYLANEEKLYLGRSGSYHSKLRREVENDYGLYEASELIIDEGIQGRVWIVDKKKNLPYSCIFTFWNDTRGFGFYYNTLLDIYQQICEQIGVDAKKAVLAYQYDDLVWLYYAQKVGKNEEPTEENEEPTDENEEPTEENEESTEENEEPSKENEEPSEEAKLLRAIHLASQAEKNEYFNGFRKTRDMKRAENNRANGWGNATQAEVNFWRNKGLDEIKRHVRQVLNEFIKNKQ